MAVDFRIVVPNDIGSTIRLGVKEPNKYDVDVSQLGLSSGINSLELSGTTLTAKTANGDKSVDLSSMLPAVVAEVFLKQVERQGNKIVFTVGEKGSTSSDTTLEVDVSDLLPVVTDNETIVGNGVTGTPLKVSISSTISNNLLKKTSDGLYVSRDDLPQPAVEPRTIRLTNASGDTVVGYIYNTEQ